MNKTTNNNLSDIGWQCSHCGAFNKVISAKFCGHCGSVRIYSEPLSFFQIIRQKIDFAKIISSSKEILNKISIWLFPPENLVFKRVISCAITLLLISIFIGYRMYSNVNTIRISKSKFSDVAIDHPVYSICKNLLGIDAISFRKNLEFAPYEKISVAEWNHVLKQASKHLNKEYSIAAYFDKNDSVSINSLNKKLRALNSSSSEINDTTRIQSYYILEQTLFN